MGPHLHLICDSTFHVGCKLKNTFGTGMCEFGLGGAFYRRSLTLVCVFMFKCDCQGLCNDVFNGVARKMQRLLAIAAALCAVTVSSHRQKGWGQHAQITLRRAESFFNPEPYPTISQAPPRFLACCFCIHRRGVIYRPPTSITLYSQKRMFYYSAIWIVKHSNFFNAHGVILC